jgi:SAM-dependent methyltransferase
MQEINDYNRVADLYDTYVPADFDIPFFLTEAGQASGPVLELMSGTGRVSLPLIQAGVNLTCVDLSRKMLSILKEKLDRRGLRADLHAMDVCELELPRQFDLAFIPFHSFAEIVSPAGQRKALARIYQHLAPGGRFICTLGNPALRRQAVDGNLRLFRKYPLPDEGTLLLWLLEKFDPQDDQVVETLEFFEEYDARGILRSKRLLELRFRLSTRDEFEERARTVGFQVLDFYGDYDYSPFSANTSPFMIWRLGKE